MKIVVDEINNKMRIDAFISNVREDISRSKAQELIKNGKILLDNKEVKVSGKVTLGQEVFIPDIIEESANENLVAENIPIDVIYEDDDILVVNKPKDMVVHPAVR